MPARTRANAHTSTKREGDREIDGRSQFLLVAGKVPSRQGQGEGIAAPSAAARNLNLTHPETPSAPRSRK